jgi:hypothetical protein
MTSTQMNLLDGLKKDLLGAADVEIRGHRYISKAALDKILPFDIVVQALSQCLSPITAELASQYAKAITFGKEVSEEDSIPDWRAVKLFAILICCDAAREIVRVLDAGVADGELPFKLDKGVSPEVLRYGARGRKTEILGCSRSWDLSLKQSFESYQKDFAPFLLRGRDFLFQVKEYWSDSDDSSGLGIPIPPIPAIKILPTVERDGPDPNRETKNSETFRVKFHPACHGLSAQNSLVSD